MYATSPRRALALPFRVLANDAGVAARLNDAFADLESASESTDVIVNYSVEFDGERGWLRTPTDQYPCTRASYERKLQQALKVDAIATSPQLTMIHGAALGTDDVTVVLTASSDAGKSTLAAGLTARGWTYFTDEVTAIDSSAQRLVPFARPLCLDRGSLALFAPTRSLTASAHVRSTVFGQPLRPSAPRLPTVFVVPRFDPTAATTAEPMSRAAMLVHVLGQSFGTVALSDVRTLATTIASSGCSALPNGSIEDATASIEALAQRRQDSVSVVESYDAATDTTVFDFGDDAVMFAAASGAAVAIDRLGHGVWERFLRGDDLGGEERLFAGRVCKAGRLPPGDLDG